MSYREGHSKIAPSAMVRVMGCPASLQASWGYDSDSQQSEAGRLGTLAHAVAQCTFYDAELPDDVDVDDAMIEAAQEYVAIVNGIEGFTTCEIQVVCNTIHSECRGYPDMVVLNHESKLCTIIDYKYGYKWVNVNENWQLLTYATGVRDKHGLPNDWTYTLAVFQPRNGGYSTVSYTSDEITTYAMYIRDRVALALTERGAATFEVGGWCLYCPHSGNCQKLTEAVFKLEDWLNGDSFHAAEPTPQRLSLELDLVNAAENLIEAKKAGLEAQILDQLGKGVGGFAYRVGNGRPSEKWNVSLGEIKQLGELMGVELVKEKPITPKQAVALKIPAEIVSEMSTVTRGKTKLVRVDLENMFATQ